MMDGKIHQCPDCLERFRYKQTMYGHKCLDGSAYISKIRKAEKEKLEKSEQHIGVA